MTESAAIPSLSTTAKAAGLARAAPRHDAVPTGPQALLTASWPTLSTALRQYEHNTAETFTREAYECVEMGLVRLDARQALAQRAAELGVKPFDAQLLIACAVRQWSLDHRYEPVPSLQAPQLSFEYTWWKRVWLHAALVLGVAAAVDYLIIKAWLH